MLSKEDYIRYIDEMEFIEHRMIELYQECAHNAQDPQMKSTCEALMRAERDHDDLVERLKKLLS